MFPHDHQKARLTNLTVVGKLDRQNVTGGKAVPTYRLTHPDVPEDLYCACKNFRVTSACSNEEDVLEAERPSCRCRISAPATAAAPATTVRPNAAPNISDAEREEQEQRESMDDAANSIANHRYYVDNRGNLTDADLAEIRAMGLEVDDDNEAVPENRNAPQPTERVGTWTIPSVCPRKAGNHTNAKGHFVGHSWEKIKHYDELQLFQICFPMEYLKEVVVPETNKRLRKTKNKTLKLPEFITFLGLTLYMACYEGISDRDLWWSQETVSPKSGAPFRLGTYMSNNRYSDIMQALSYTNIPAPTTFVDPFHHVRQMQDAFNAHYEENYVPSWFSCLDESMIDWLNKYCPGWMCVPRKPHPFGNEYFTIADGDKMGKKASPIMYRCELREGKDRPAELGKKEFDELGPTVGVMLRMTKNLWNTGKCVTMDSGFCVAKGIIELHRKGVFGQALIKMRGRGWPRGVPGKQIDDDFKDKEVGATETLVQEMDDGHGGKVKFLIHCQKDVNYVTKIMSTHGVLTEVSNHETSRALADGSRKKFKYPEPISRHNYAKHWVDDVNSRRHDPIAINDVWRTKWWPTRQITMFVGVAEVNANNTRARARGVPAEPQLDFRKNFAWKMIENNLDNDGDVISTPEPVRTRSARAIVAEHSFETRPNFSSIWLGDRWKEASNPYQKTVCRCGQRCRTYCACDRRVTLCKNCYGLHLLTG